MIELPQHNHPKDEWELRKQLNIEDRWPVALIAVISALIVLSLVVAVIAGLSFEHWKHLIRL